jgi:hypothetical protein
MVYTNLIMLGTTPIVWFVQVIIEFILTILWCVPINVECVPTNMWVVTNILGFIPTGIWYAPHIMESASTIMGLCPPFCSMYYLPSTITNMGLIPPTELRLVSNIPYLAQHPHSLVCSLPYDIYILPVAVCTHIYTCSGYSHQH